MEDKEAIEMMNRCIHEIEDLRRTNTQLTPAAEAYEVIRKITHGLAPVNRMGYSEDLVWRLRKKIQELQPKPKADDAE
jgi:hypothetical protein